MTTLSCTQIRDILPERVSGQTLPAVDEHLSACAECRAEAELIVVLRAAAPVAAPALAAAVREAVHRRPAPRRRFHPRRLAFAATLAGAVIGGTLLVEAVNLRRGPRAPSAATAGAESDGFLPVLEDPALTGGSVLPDLTEAELESLLARMES